MTLLHLRKEEKQSGIKLHMISTIEKERSMKRLFLCILLAAVSTSLAWAQGEAALAIVEDSLIITSVPLRSGSTVDLHAKIFENVSSTCQAGVGNTVLAIHGPLMTANSWRNYAYALLDNSQNMVWDGATITGNICRFVALDLPGHGRSSFPAGGNLMYGDLLLEDYVQAIFAGMNRLRTIQVRPTILIGHSTGGLLVEMMQDTLIKQGRNQMGREYNLRSVYDIRNVILLAPAPPGNFRWPTAEDPGGITGWQQFINIDPQYGLYFLLDYPAWTGFLFLGMNGDLAPSIPSATEAAQQQYISPEPLSIFLEASNFGPLHRPSVAPGIFAPNRGTKLYLVGYENDTLMALVDHAGVYRHLTYDNTRSRYAVVGGPESVHGIHVGNAVLLLKRLEGQVEIPYMIGDDIKP